MFPLIISTHDLCPGTVAHIAPRDTLVFCVSVSVWHNTIRTQQTQINTREHQPRQAVLS